MYDHDEGPLGALGEALADKIGQNNHRIKIFDLPKGMCMSCHVIIRSSIAQTR